MCIIDVQMKSILNLFILVILASIKVAKLIFFMCLKTCTYKSVSRCETWYFMPGVKFYCLVIKERVYSGKPDTTLTMVMLSKECSI